MGRLRKKQIKDFFPPELFNNSEIEETKKKGHIKSNDISFVLHINAGVPQNIFLIVNSLLEKYIIVLKITLNLMHIIVEPLIIW